MISLYYTYRYVYTLYEYTTYLARPTYSMHVCNMYVSTCDKTICEHLKIAIFLNKLNKLAV